jgi:drug/metabolite transporter (DMT)-like permease
VWIALGLSLVGLTLVSEVWSGLKLDTLGIVAGLLDAVALAVYFLLGEGGVVRRDPLSFVCFSLFFASLFWAIAQPWWSFPFHAFQDSASLHGHLAAHSAPLSLLVAWLVVLGTIVPSAVSIGALRHLPATTMGLVATFDPVAASVVAWLWLGESLDPAQIGGGAIVLAGIVLAQTAR